jgi:CRP-like cAMP-binding protein
MAPPATTAERTYLARLIEGAALFRSAPPDDVAELSRAARIVAFQRGKEIAPAKGKEAEIYIVETGAVALLDREPSADKGILIALYGPHEIAGLSAAAGLFDGGRSAGDRELRALSNATVVAVPAADLLRICRRTPEVAAAMIAALGAELRNLAQLLTTALQSSLELRLASFFSQLATIETGNKWEPTANIGRLPQTLIADLLGVSREHVNRTMIMWEKSGLIFQARNGDVVIENRKRLTQLAGARRASAPSTLENEWRWEIEAHLNYGLNEAAHNLAMESVKRSPRDDRFKYLAALAMARTGALKEALALVEAFKLTTDAPNEDIASIGPRLRRDLAFAAPGAPDRAMLRAAAEGYEKVFRALHTTYPGVNAATTYAMSGETAKAKKLASEVATLAAAAIDALDDDDLSYWERATLGECRLVAGDLAGAATEFASAMAAENAAPGKIATTRKQLRRLKDATGVDDAYIDRVAPQGEVLYFSGPLAPKGDAADAMIARLRSSFEKVAEKRHFVAGIGALAAGADIVIAEMLLEAGVPLHVHLPLAPADFLEASVAPSGDPWRERFIRCIEKAQTIDWARRMKGARAAYRLGSRVAIGKAARQASDLATSPFGFFALQRGRTGVDSISHENAELWRALGYASETVLDDWAGKTGKVETTPAIATALVIDGAIDKKLAAGAMFEASIGDLGVLAFETTDAAIAAARRAATGPSAGATRFWLDIGVADGATKAGREAFPAALVTAACRPQTPPGKCYASDSFVYAAAAAPAATPRFEYAGIAATEEKLDPCPMFLVDL